MDDCIFCKIIKGEIPSYKIYEDGEVLAFLDINPLSEGHSIVIPKEHYVNILDIPEDIYSKIGIVVKKIAKALDEKYHPEGILINQNNGKRAGQEIFHMHIHIKPIYSETEVFDETNHRKKPSKEELEKMMKELSFN